MFGAKRRRARELADEMVKPLGGIGMLDEDSKRTLEAECLQVVRHGREQPVYDSQKGWKKGEFD